MPYISPAEFEYAVFDWHYRPRAVLRFSHAWPDSQQPPSSIVAPRIYSPRGYFVDRVGRFDYVYPELLRDPTLPSSMLSLPNDPDVAAYGTDRRERFNIDEWDTADDC